MTDLARLRRLRRQLAAEHAKAVAADQHPRPDLDHLRVTAPNGIAAGLEVAIFFADHHLREVGEARTTPDNPAASSNAVDNCCVCGGSPVVYRNYREQPFCWPCADCSCNQDVCVRTGINDPAVSGDAALRQQIAAAEHRLRLAHEARRAKEHQLDGIRRALCDVGAMRDDDPYSHADLEDVIRQVFMPPLPVASGEWLRTGTLDLSIPDQPQEPQ